MIWKADHTAELAGEAFLRVGVRFCPLTRRIAAALACDGQQSAIDSDLDLLGIDARGERDHLDCVRRAADVDRREGAISEGADAGDAGGPEDFLELTLQTGQFRVQAPGSLERLNMLRLLNQRAP